MRSSHLIFLALILTLFSCTRKKSELLLTRWEQTGDQFSSLERKFASTSHGQCFSDLFTVETLQEEIKEIEKQYAAAPQVSGRWRHLDLSRLPVPQANFLKKFGQEIGDLRDPDKIEYSSCSDVPCLFNKIYNRDDDVAGYVHYLWFLRFGHMLSADNKIADKRLFLNQSSTGDRIYTPGTYGGKSYPLEAFLYQENELYAFWRLSQMLKAPHTNLRYLREIQRMPRGANFDDPEYVEACGLAHSFGLIELTDGCLQLSESNRDRGFLYQAVTHELTHHVDFEEGRGSRDFYRSRKQDYMDVAKIYEEERIEDGRIVIETKLREGGKLITPYAGKNHAENFAESIGVFRIDGESAKKNLTQEHYLFVSRNYYDNRKFDREEILKSYMTEYAGEINQAALKAVIECNKNPTVSRSSYFHSSEFNVRILPSMLSCLGHKAEEISGLIRSRSALYRPQGCEIFADDSVRLKWNLLMKEALTKIFGQYLAELEGDKEYLEKVETFYREISDGTIANVTYVSCYGVKDDESCFYNELRKSAFEKALSLKIPEAQVTDMVEMYVSHYPFAAVKKNVQAMYQIMIAGNADLIRRNSERTWEYCRDLKHNDDLSPTGNIFQLGEGYMVSSFYNCLNTSIPDGIKEAVRSISVKGLKVQHAKEEEILYQEIKIPFLTQLRERYLEERMKELKTARIEMEDDKGELRKKILKDLSWVKSILDPGAIRSDCEKTGMSLISSLPLYHLKQDLYHDLLVKSCTNIHQEEEFRNWLEKSKEEFSQKLMTSIDERILELARVRAEQCLMQYPVNSNVNRVRFRKEREGCLLTDWETLEAKVLASIYQDSLVAQLNVSEDVIKLRLENGRRRIQLRVLKEKF
jgi:hypothetical protein